MLAVEVKVVVACGVVCADEGVFFCIEARTKSFEAVQHVLEGVVYYFTCVAIDTGGSSSTATAALSVIAMG